MSEHIIILGAGPGGYTAALHASRLGARVTVIENEGLGGTCLNWGCIPTKTIKASTDALNTARRLDDFGIKMTGTVGPDMQAILARKDRVVAALVQGLQKSFKKERINLVRGFGRLTAPNKVQVKTDQGETLELAGDKIILAPGSRPLEIPALPVDGEYFLSSTDALALKEIPDDILIVGGGVIGLEFGFIFQALGSRVTIVEALDRVIPMPSIDPDISKLLQREMKKRKMALHLQKTVALAERGATGKIRAVLQDSRSAGENTLAPDAGQAEILADKILVTVGRGYNTLETGVQDIGVACHPMGWVLADEQLATNLRGVYAIGDVLGPDKVMLAHVAAAEGRVAAENCLGAANKMNYSAVPGAVFTDPEIAYTGLSEAAAIEMDIPVRSDSIHLRGLGKAQAMGELAGMVKLISHAGSRRVLGAQIAGPHASDLIAEVTLAIRMGATADDLADTIHVHPSFSEAVEDAARVVSFPGTGGS